MFIEIKGVEFENKGAELMLVSILQRMKTYWPDAKLVIAPSNKSPYLKRADLGAYQKLNVRKSYLDLNGLTDYIPAMVRNWLKKWGIVTEADIDVILDACGFSYSDQWGTEMRIRHVVAEIRRLRKRGKKYIFMPQALGPFNAPKVKKMIHDGFPAASLVCARDEDSFTHVKNAAGPFDSLRQVNDFTNAMSGITPDYFVDGEKKICIIPNKNMVNPRNNNQAWIDCYVETLAFFVELAIERGYQPFMLNHEGQEDGKIIEQVLTLSGKALEVIVEDDPLKVKGIIQASAGSVCSRYHGCVSALSSGKVCIGTSWSHKYERLYEEYQVRQLLISPTMDKTQLTEIFDSMCDPDSPVAGTIRENAKKYKAKTEALWQEVEQIVGELNSHGSE